MPTLRPFEEIDAGGVDSRSNPVNMPRNRALRCLNWCPKQGGWWEQRYGYSTVSMSTVTASAISGIFPYRQWNGNRYTIFMQGTTWQLLNNATGTVTTPPVRGAAISSSAKGNGYFANNRFHYGNGTDQKWFDGTTWRTNGLLDQVSAGFNISNIGVAEGVRELTTTQAAAVTLTPGAGGTFAGDSIGRSIYVVIFDTTQNEIGPATISVGSGRVVVPLNDKLTVGSLPNVSGLGTGTWVKLIGGTADGGTDAFFFTNTSTNISGIAKAISNPIQLQVSATAHGLSAGDVVIISGTGVNDGIYAVLASGLGANSFNVRIFSGACFSGVSGSGAISTLSQGGNTGAVGTVKRIVQAGAAVASVDVAAPTQDVSYKVNQNIGLPASAVGGSSAGYQFAACLYNKNGGGHISNYVLIGARALQTGYRSNWHIFGLPTVWTTDSEWSLLIGRTGDGAQVPYPCVDLSFNLQDVVQYDADVSSTVGIVINSAQIGTQPMPTRNGIIPSQCTMFAVAGDFCYAADPASPYLRRSGDLSQAVERGNTVLGRPEQSWAANDIDTFPTGEALTGMFEVDQEVFCGTLHDCALSVNLAGIQQWNGPWAIGIAGPRAGTKCGANGFYWVTGDKQLATFIQGVPTIVSDEYELAELAQFGSAFLSTIECVYIRYPSIGKEELRIEGQLSGGAPYTVIHDFKLREPYSAPGSIYGQGYSSQFQGPLATVFTSTLVRDGNGQLQIWAGASNGQIYQLYTGADDVSNQFNSDLILLINGGPERPQVPFIDFYGDQNIKVTVGRNFQTSLATGAQYGFDPPSADTDAPQSVPGAEQDFLYRVWLNPPEVQRLYARFQLTSHSADGSLALNSPPHLPLESYGRLYELVPAIDGERER